MERMQRLRNNTIRNQIFSKKIVLPSIPKIGCLDIEEQMEKRRKVKESKRIRDDKIQMAVDSQQKARKRMKMKQDIPNKFKVLPPIKKPPVETREVSPEKTTARKKDQAPQPRRTTASSKSSPVLTHMETPEVSPRILEQVTEALTRRTRDKACSPKEMVPLERLIPHAAEERPSFYGDMSEISPRFESYEPSDDIVQVQQAALSNPTFKRLFNRPLSCKSGRASIVTDWRHTDLNSPLTYRSDASTLSSESVLSLNATSNSSVRPPTARPVRKIKETTDNCAEYKETARNSERVKECFEEPDIIPMSPVYGPSSLVATDRDSTMISATNVDLSPSASPITTPKNLNMPPKSPISRPSSSTKVELYVSVADNDALGSGPASNQISIRSRTASPVDLSIDSSPPPSGIEKTYPIPDMSMPTPRSPSNNQIKCDSRQDSEKDLRMTRDTPDMPKSTSPDEWLSMPKIGEPLLQLRYPYVYSRCSSSSSFFLPYYDYEITEPVRCECNPDIPGPSTSKCYSPVCSISNQNKPKQQDKGNASRASLSPHSPPQQSLSRYSMRSPFMHHNHEEVLRPDTLIPVPQIIEEGRRSRSPLMHEYEGETVGSVISSERISSDNIKRNSPSLIPVAQIVAESQRSPLQPLLLSRSSMRSPLMHQSGIETAKSGINLQISPNTTKRDPRTSMPQIVPPLQPRSPFSRCSNRSLARTNSDEVIGSEIGYNTGSSIKRSSPSSILLIEGRASMSSVQPRSPLNAMSRCSTRNMAGPNGEEQTRPEIAASVSGCNSPLIQGPIATKSVSPLSPKSPPNRFFKSSPFKPTAEDYASLLVTSPERIPCTRILPSLIPRTVGTKPGSPLQPRVASPGPLKAKPVSPLLQRSIPSRYLQSEIWQPTAADYASLSAISPERIPCTRIMPSLIPRILGTTSGSPLQPKVASAKPIYSTCNTSLQNKDISAMSQERTGSRSSKRRTPSSITVPLSPVLHTKPVSKSSIQKASEDTDSSVESTKKADKSDSSSKIPRIIVPEPTARTSSKKSLSRRSTRSNQVGESLSRCSGRMSKSPKKETSVTSAEPQLSTNNNNNYLLTSKTQIWRIGSLRSTGK